MYIPIFAAAMTLYGQSAMAAENHTDTQADNTEQASSPETNETNTRQIEQITVIGERSLLTMRNEIIREEDVLYRLFNELNSNDRFDIFCHKKSNTVSLIPKRSCEPQFLKNHRQQSNRHALGEMRQSFSADGINYAILQNGLDMLEPEDELRRQLTYDYEDMNEEMLRIAMDNPDYMATLQKIARLRLEYLAARAEKFGND